MPDSELSPLVAALLADRGLTPQGPGRAGLPLEIDPRDEMLSFLLDANQGDRDRALFLYYLSGLSIADALRQLLLWRFGAWERLGPVLDFASGYGRVTRFLLRDLPAERVWVADIYGDAVDFQSRRFGVHGLISASLPEDFDCSERFDAILVTSLFTHLPEERFVAWLRRLGSLLRPGGLLVFSVHDDGVLAPAKRMPESGILFETWSESASLDTADYGSTWVTEGFVRGALLRALPEGSFSVHRLPRALYNIQDLYAVVLEPGVDFSGLAFDGEPQLFLERCSFTGIDQLEISGWAALRRPGHVREVQVTLDGVILASCPVDGERPDVASILGDPSLRPGWHLRVSLPAGLSRSRAVLLLRTVDDRGVARPVEAGSIEWALWTGARRDVERLQRALSKTGDRLQDVEGRSRARIEWLEARMAGMEESRFWKMRAAWFGLKRALGLTDEA